jgi:6-phosphogluconolactonase
MEVSVHPDPERLAQAAAAAIAETLAASDDRASLGLAGGSTPKATYVALRLQSVTWDRVDLWLTDERWVPWDHTDSNGRMALEVLADPVDAHLLRPRWSEHLEPADSAAFYEAELRHIHAARPPDVMLLGMGTDGHTASLFPGTDALAHPEGGRWFVANHVPQLDTWRLTVTPSFLQAAPRVIVLVAGVDKAEVLAEAVEGPPDRHPIQLLAGCAGEVTVFADEAAASRIGGR